ncbi:MAG: glycosyltransferase [Eubacteriales bacterium]|nr:glycosyltransferase [Eubacteriales bacterium]
MKYILSIIIPTKNRQKYCLAAIRQILSLNLSEIEICIQDNSDTDILRNEISSIASENIVYNYHEGVLSFVDNFSEAVSLSHGEYLCMIGDDDGILPSIMDMVRFMKGKGIDSLIPSLGAVYYWPSDNPIVANGEKGVLTLSYLRSKARYTNSKKALLKLLKGAVQNYTSLDMPRLYHGIVKQTCLEDIKEQTGKYFDGLTPDIYMAVALSFVCKKTLRIDTPITISGICPTSGSNDSATGKHTGKLEDAPHFRGHTDYHWDEHIPAFYSVDTIWAETLMQALTMFKRDDLKSKFNMPLFEIICLKKYPEYKNIIKKHAKKELVSIISMKKQNLLLRLQILKKKVLNKLNPKFKTTYQNVQDIQIACEISSNSNIYLMHDKLCI